MSAWRRWLSRLQNLIRATERALKERARRAIHERRPWTSREWKTLAAFTAVAAVLVSLVHFHDTRSVELQQRERDVRLSLLDQFGARLPSDAPACARRLVENQRDSADITWLIAIDRHLAHSNVISSKFFHWSREWRGKATERYGSKAGDAMKQHLKAQSFRLLEELCRQLTQRTNAFSGPDDNVLHELAIFSALNLEYCGPIDPLLQQYVRPPNDPSAKAKDAIKAIREACAKLGDK